MLKQISPKRETPAPNPLAQGTTIKPDHDIILEEEAEDKDEQSDQEQLDKDIQEFLKNSRIHMQRQSHLGKMLTKSEQFSIKEKEGGMPTMKGNIGPTSKHLMLENNDTSLK